MQQEETASTFEFVLQQYEQRYIRIVSVIVVYLTI